MTHHAEFQPAGPDSMPVLALAGNPNAGKTTAFNAYTGSRQHVGNYPGITVEKKEGVATVDGQSVRLIDLPGAYSLTAYTQEERVARRAIASEAPLAVMAVLNAGALERNLYLVVQLLEMGVPVALGLNMMDEAHRMGLTIDSRLLARHLDAPVVETVARTGQGLEEFLREALRYGRSRWGQPWRPLNISYGPDLDPVLTELTRLLEKTDLPTPYPARWIALKLLERDEEILGYIRSQYPDLAHELHKRIGVVESHLRSTLDTSPEAIIADYRYGFIASLLRGGVLVRHTDITARMLTSDRADKILTHQLLGPGIMLGILYLMYRITFSMGEVPMTWVAAGFEWLRSLVEMALPDGPLKSMLTAGVIDGVGGVMSFVPLILLIFLQIAILEDSGYMARMAYMLDRIFRLFGLHGSSVVPYILGGGIAGGCAVPGIMAARTLRSPREKLATVLTVPFMACGAKLPVFILFAGVFFPGHEALVMFGLTLTGWVVAMLTARALRSLVIRGPATPFVMELPPYRLPTIRGLLIHAGERTWQFLKKAGTVILAISILLWAAMAYPSLSEAENTRFDDALAALAEQIKEADPAARVGLQVQLAEMEGIRNETALRSSLAGRVGMLLEPVTRYAGFGWEANISLLGGFAAKEVIVSSLGTAYSLYDREGEQASLARHISEEPGWTVASAVAFLVFVLLYAPCFVSLVAIRQETGSTGWAVFSLVFNTLLAFAAAVAVFQILSRL